MNNGLSRARGDYSRRPETIRSLCAFANSPSKFRSSELEPSVPDFKGISEIQKPSDFPFTFTSTYTSTSPDNAVSLTLNLLPPASSFHSSSAKPSLPHSLPNSISSQVKAQPHRVTEADPLRSVLVPRPVRTSKHVHLKPQLSSSPQDDSKLTILQFHSRPWVQQVPPHLSEPQTVLKQILSQEASHQSSSQGLALSPTSSLPNTPPKLHQHVAPAMSQPQWNGSKGPKSSPMKVQDSNQKITTPVNDPFTAGPPQKVKVTNQTPVTSTLPPHLRGGFLPPHLRGKPKDEGVATKVLTSREPGAGVNVSVKVENPPAATTSQASSTGNGVQADREKTNVKAESRPATSSGGWGGQPTADTKLLDEMVLQEVKVR